MRKKSGKKAAMTYCDALSDTRDFLARVSAAEFSDMDRSWCFDYAIIRIYREFEKMIQECLVAAINNDTDHISSVTGITFPKHLTDEVCQYLIVGDGFFDFRGRDGLIRTLRRFLPEDHYLVSVVKRETYKITLERLATLRNFAAHNSARSKRAALAAVGGKRVASAGAWLKKGNRFEQLIAKLEGLTDEICESAPY